jgi:hypothetical protein
MSDYTERDAVRAIVLISDDGGLTWYPRDGDPADAAPLEPFVLRVIRLESADAGTTWTPAT